MGQLIFVGVQHAVCSGGVGKKVTSLCITETKVSFNYVL